MSNPGSLETYEVVKRFELLHRAKIVALAVTIHIALCMRGAYVHSPTVDEPAYLASGIIHWKFGRFDLCKVSPPLVRLVAAMPVLLMQAEYDWSSYEIRPDRRTEHVVGRGFLIANGERSFWLFTLARWACLPFSLLGAFVCYLWAKELFGQASAYLAFLLWCFSPNILAHAQLLTPDVGVTSLSLAACWLFWRWSRNPSRIAAAGWGAVLGLAVLAKTNAVALYAALPMGMLCQCSRAGCIVSIKRRLALQMVLGIATSVYVINLGYGFERAGRPLGEYEFVSSAFIGPNGSNCFRDTIFEDVRVPFPAAFVEGIDLQRRDFENETQHFRTYLRGNWYDRSWWWYYLYVVGMKVPEATWLLGIAGAATILLSNERFRACSIPMISGILLFALPCSQTGFGGSLRYVLPAFPFAFLVASAAVDGGCWKRVISGILVLWLLLSSLACYPHSLSYFNSIAGGPANGHAHLLDGNVDWGQDLLFMVRWIEEHPEARPVYASYSGPLPEDQMGVRLLPPRLTDQGEFPAGFYLVPVNHLRGNHRNRGPELRGFLKLPVLERVTPAVNVYRLDESTGLSHGISSAAD